MKTALVYDRVNKWGGAERVLLSLHKLFPDAPLFTSVYDRQSAEWAGEFDVKTSFLQDIPLAKKNHEAFAVLMPVAFESFIFDEYDLVISVTSESAKGIITKPKTCHVSYILTPTRYLWSGYNNYFENSTLKFISRPAISYLRDWDLIASKRPDYLLSISKEVSGRVRKYYGIDSKVIYPPLGLVRKKTNSSSGDFFLMVGRMVSYKKLDLVVDAFKKNKMKLKIIGSGRQYADLKKKISPNIEIISEVSDDELSNLYSSAKALVFPGLEDFGLVMAEAQSFGTPVIAYRGGGALEIIIEGKTGEFFNDQSVESLLSVLSKFDNKSYNPNDIQKNAERFSFNRFSKEFLEFTKTKYAEHQENYL